MVLTVYVHNTLLSDLDGAIFAATGWDLLTPSASRQQIDDAVFDALGLTAGKRDGVYAGVRELVGNRRRRAGNFSG